LDIISLEHDEACFIIFYVFRMLPFGKLVSIFSDIGSWKLPQIIYVFEHCSCLWISNFRIVGILSLCRDRPIKDNLALSSEKEGW
jgi:hypothetical protein